MYNTQKFFVIEPTQRGWRTSKLGKQKNLADRSVGYPATVQSW